MPSTTITPPVTAEARRAALLEFAENVHNESSWHQRPVTGVIDLILPTLVSHLCEQPRAMFDQLVEAVRERDRFVADEHGYATANGYPPHPAALQRLHDRLQGAVDELLDALVRGL